MSDIDTIDDLLPEIDMYRLYYRFLETADEYFEYPTHASGQGRWCIYGLDLPEDVLRKVAKDLSASGLKVSEGVVRGKMDEFLAIARDQLKSA